jgi:DNA-binding PadR family transcriptional regulator
MRNVLSTPKIDRPLSFTSYAVLGMIALRGPSTAYDVKRAMAHLTEEFWAVPHAQYYVETERLEQLGLLHSEQEPQGRRRRVYTVTPAGEKALDAWLAEPAFESIQLRDVALLKLFMSERMNPESVQALAQAQLAAYHQRIEVLDRVTERFQDRPDLASRLTTVAFGRAVYEAAINFWTTVREQHTTSTSSDG